MNQITKNKLVRFFQSSRLNLAAASVVAVVVVITGFAIKQTIASGFFAFLEGEQGTVSGNAQVINDTSASGGKAIRFAPASTTTGATTTCPLPKYPDASCTGVPAGTVLTDYTGPMNITTPNTIIDSKRIYGCLTINAPGVVVKNSWVNAPCDGTSTIQVNSASIYHPGFSGAGAIIQDSTIGCYAKDSQGNFTIATSATGIGDNNVTALRNNISGCENGFDMDLNADIEDNYIHDLYQSDVAHTDGLQSADGTNLKLIHNTFYGDTPFCANADFCAGTSAININNCDPAKHPCPRTLNAVVKDNLLAGGAETLLCPFIDTNFQVINNHFSFKFRDPNSPRAYGPNVAPPWKPEIGPGVGAYGPESDCQDEAVLSGNVYHETGQPVVFN